MVHLYSEVLLSHKKYILKYADKWMKLNKLVHLNMHTWPPKLSHIIQQWMSLNSLCRPVWEQTHSKKAASFCLQSPDFEGVQNCESILCINVFVKGIFVFGFFSWFLHVFWSHVVNGSSPAWAFCWNTRTHNWHWQKWQNSHKLTPQKPESSNTFLF